jgi:hypothetical protein
MSSCVMVRVKNVRRDSGARFSGGGGGMCAGVREVVDSACYFLRSSLGRLGTIMCVVVDVVRRYSSE